MIPVKTGSYCSVVITQNKIKKSISRIKMENKIQKNFKGKYPVKFFGKKKRNHQMINQDQYPTTTNNNKKTNVVNQIPLSLNFKNHLNIQIN